MILFDYRIGVSQNNGLGLFTKEKIGKGQVCFVSTPNLDQTLTEEEFAYLPNVDQEEIIHYGYKDERTNLYRLDFDVGLRFLNHSADSNITQDINDSDTYLTAKRDIEAGEEILWNYLEIMDIEFFRKGFNYLPIDDVEKLIEESLYANTKEQ
ncbi:MAG: SET domain-containing protein [Treponema sp.]|nr:SET domain-containing protein [Treponema sp.]